MRISHIKFGTTTQRTIIWRTTLHLEELEAKLLRDEDEAIAAMPLPSSSSASASVRVPTIVPLLMLPPPTPSRGGHVPSSFGRVLCGRKLLEDHHYHDLLKN